MKINIKILLITAFLFLAGFSVIEKRVLITEEAKQMENLILEIESAVNTSNAQKLLDLTSDSAGNGLKEEIVKAIYGRKFVYTMEIDSSLIEELGDDKIRVRGKFNVKGLDYEKKSVKTYFTFVKEDNNWKIYDTNFHHKIQKRNFWLFFIEVIFPVFLIVFPIEFFWIWMLYDCAKYQEKNNVLWLQLIILFNALGALIYFIVIKRKRMNNTKLKISKENEKNK